MTEDVPMYEAPVEFEPESTSSEIDLIKASQSLANNGHVPEAATWGNFVGHRCSRCGLFRNKNFFDFWMNGPRCEPTAPGQSHKDILDSEQLFKRRKAEDQAADKLKANEKIAQHSIIQFKVKDPTKEDELECHDLNEPSIFGNAPAANLKSPVAPVVDRPVVTPLPTNSRKRDEASAEFDLETETEDEEEIDIAELNGDPRPPQKF